MTDSGKGAQPIRAFIEVGRSRCFAGAVVWPGWCRSGRNEREALTALMAYGPRYARVVQRLGLELRPPVDVRRFMIHERVGGSVTTDFGAPDSPLVGDADPMTSKALRNQVWILTSCFRALEAALIAAEGRSLRLGPRGGGRALPAILEHVLQANRAYLQRLAWKPQQAGADPRQWMRVQEAETMDALAAASEGQLPAAGPRGGKVWTARFFTRRVAWHLLDHAWEIEDRMT